ncbi:MAG: NAD(P)H-hydrate dehydratase [Bacteroidota bacterium]
MLKILSVQQIRDLDQYTIDHEPIASIDLMERASAAFCTWYTSCYGPNKRIGILCGVGNNGGDGLAIARILLGKNYFVHVYILGDINKSSKDFSINLSRMDGNKAITVEEVSDLEQLSEKEIIIDALFGSGLSRHLDGLNADVVEYVNKLDKVIISVDIASGLFADLPGRTDGRAIEPNHTVAFQVPKLSFLLPQNDKKVGHWHLVDIGLSEEFIGQLSSENFLLKEQDIRALIKKKGKFDHKGTNGRALIVAGSYGKIGAAVLSAQAAMRSGLGLLTMNIPMCGYDILQTSIPEAMVITDNSEHAITEINVNSNFDAIGIGPGLGRGSETSKALLDFIRDESKPLVVDADALNIIGDHSEIIATIPENSIFTPHPKEFERLVGTWSDDYERLSKQRDFSNKHKIIVALKGAHTSISDSDGQIYFNTTGNPGMATAGSGDVLLGIITSFLAQGYSPINSAIMGVFIHGLAGDMASKAIGEYALIASDIIQSIPKAIQSLSN